jgi:signal transduction histidine kinase
LFSFSLVLYTTFGSALSRHFDARLESDAETVAHTIEENADGSLEFEGLSEFERMFEGAYFEVHLDDRSVFARSRALANHALRRDIWSVESSVQVIALPDGTSGRAYSAALLPRADENLVKPTGPRIWVTVARSTAELDATLATLRLLLWVSGLSSLAVASLVGVFAIGRGLKPLRRLMGRVDGIDARRLGERLPIDDLPRELQPLASKLNELLGRIEVSLSREREWNTAVSHELRTPLAGLRAIFEVSESRERSSAEYRTAIGDARQIVTQMSQLVDQLLLLARLDAHAWALTRDRVDLRELVDSCLAAQLPKVRARGLRLDNRVPPDLVLRSDHDKLRIVVSNLISNAIEYGDEGGQIQIDSDVAGGCLLAVCNSGPPIPDGVLLHIFEPFVRLDRARSSSGEHCGIGLTLVRALCETLGLSISAQNRADGRVSFTIGAGSTDLASDVQRGGGIHSQVIESG